MSENISQPQARKRNTVADSGLANCTPNCSGSRQTSLDSETDQRNSGESHYESPRQHSHQRFTTVALIGPDGSGKSAVAKALLENCPVPLKYMYMGTSIESSNIALPTSRWIHRWKVYQHKKSLKRSGKNIPENVTLHGMEHRVDKRGKLGGVGRLFRRVSEEIYRQLVSWIFQLRGNVVLYDRHFLFDACPVPTDTGDHRFTDRVHHWFLKRLYPRPGLAIFLDAPAEVLYARKQEVPVEYLERERIKLLQKSSYAKKFVSVDCTQPLEDVVITIKRLISDHCGKQRAQHGSISNI